MSGRTKLIEYINTNVNELRKADRIKILCVIHRANVNISEKSDGVCVFFKDIPTELLEDIRQTIETCFSKYEEV